MTIKFGSLTNPSVNILKEIERVKEQGFDFVEIGIESPQGLSEILYKKRNEIKKLLRGFKASPIGHTPWWMELGSHHEDIRKAWIEEGKKTIDISKELGIRLINFHSHSVGMILKTKYAKNKTLNNFAESMKELVKYGKAGGVGVMLENMPTSIKEFKDFKYIIDNVKGLGVHLDVGHAFVNGEMNSVIKYIRTFKKKLMHIHISDNKGQWDEHLPLGAGELDYDKVIKELKKIKYNKTITPEVFSKDRDLIINSREKIRRLL